MTKPYHMIVGFLKGTTAQGFIMASVMFAAVSSYAAMDSRALYDQGMEAFKKGNYGSAELLFRKIVKSGDDEYIDRAWFHLARSIFNKGKYDLALFELKNFLNKCKTDALCVESRYWMGECYFNMTDKPNAIEEFRRFISVAGEGELAQTAHDRIGMIYLSQKRYDEAVIEWESARSKSTDQHKNHIRQYWIGDALYRNGKYDEALQKLSPVVAVLVDPRISAMADMVLGRIYQKKGDHQKALQMFSSIPASYMKEDPFEEVAFFKARSHSRLGQKAQARTLLESFLAGSKDSRWYISAQYELGVILIQGPDHEEGITLLDEVRGSSGKPDLKSRASLKIGRYYADRSPDKAVPFLEESLKTAKEDKRKNLLIFIGKTCMRAKKYDKAVDHFGLYLKENPFDASRDEINFLRARAYLEMGEIDRATNIFEANRKDNPFSKYIAESNYYMALVRYKQGNKAKAISLLREYLNQKNGEQAYDAYVLLVRIYLDKDDLGNAGRAAEALTREFLNRKDVETVLYDYATALMKKGRDARRFVNLILNRFPGSESAADIYMVLGNDSFNRNRYNAALECFNNYLNTSYTRNRGNAFYKMLVSLYSLKRYDDVIAAIKKGNYPSLTESQWKEIPVILARSYYALKKCEDVYMTLDKKNLRDYPGEDIIMYIRCALKTGDYRSAMEANDFLEKDKPFYAESLLITGEYLLRKESSDEAELYFMKIINECPGTPFVYQAKLSLGEMKMMERKFTEAIHHLSTVENTGDKNIQNRKNSLLIRCYIETGMIDKAVALTEAHIQEMQGNEHGEPVFLGLVRHYYKKNDLPQFERYVKYLARYPGHETELIYMSGKIYFQSGNYHAAYNYFLALSRMKSPHVEEAFYFMGLYNLLVARNAGSALIFFSRLIEMEEASITIKRKALIQIAIIYREMNNNAKSIECLKKVLSKQHRGLTHVQAINLYSEFGYNGK